MDLTHANTLVAAIKSAKTQEERLHAHDLAMIALIECQQKTAERVKRLSWKVFGLVAGAGGGAGALVTNLEWIKGFFN